MGARNASLTPLSCCLVSMHEQLCCYPNVSWWCHACGIHHNQHGLLCFALVCWQSSQRERCAVMLALCAATRARVRRCVIPADNTVENSAQPHAACMSCSRCGRICIASAAAVGVGLLPYSFSAHSYLSLVCPVPYGGAGTLYVQHICIICALPV